MTHCPCCELSYETCCAPYIEGRDKVSSPIALMRTRYTAFSKGLVEYLYNTCANALRQQICIDDLASTCHSTFFIKLEIVDVSAVDILLTVPNSEKNWVEFKAHYIDKDGYSVIHERSKFIFEDNGWKYESGTQFDVPTKKLNRNDPCPCLSGKKYKKCHLSKV
jgi:SEC-C motif domain protein